MVLLGKYERKKHNIEFTLFFWPKSAGFHQGKFHNKNGPNQPKQNTFFAAQYVEFSCDPKTDQLVAAFILKTKTTCTMASKFPA